MITVTNLAVRAGAFRLDGVSFRATAGEYVVLMGKTGCGKTTLLEVICGLKPVQGGSIHLHGRDVTHLKPAERGIGYVPQDLALFPTLTVREHLAFALLVRHGDSQTIQRRVDELSELLGVGHLLERKPHGLSGGEAQRIALGRALAFRPPILLLDEPLSALDDETRSDMAALLRSVRKRTGVTVLHVTHSLSEAKKLADRLLLLKNGRIEEAPLSPPSESGDLPNASIRGAGP
ncbi:MAG TPA: ABC transporter ATP-binding protein [Gemmataceae bacterium]